MAQRRSLDGCCSIRTVDPDPAPRVEGEPFYTLRDFIFERQRSTDDNEADVAMRPLVVRLRAYLAVPLADAVGLLSGEDHTGLVVWDGSTRLVEWIFSAWPPAGGIGRFSSPGAAAGPLDSGCFVELGAGSALVSCALIQLLLRQHREAGPAVSVIATDGNEQCVCLSQRNIAETLEESARPEVLSDVGQVLHSLETKNPRESVCAEAVLFNWSSGDCPDPIRCAFERRSTSAGGLTILSADVIYFKDAVVPLVGAVRTIANAFFAQHPSSVVWWVIWYMPRALRSKENAEIFALLLSQVESCLECHGVRGVFDSIALPGDDRRCCGLSLLDLREKMRIDPTWFPPDGCRLASRWGPR
jgi:hypothetical protein